MSAMFRVHWVHDMLYLPFTDGALKGHFGKVKLEKPPLSVAVKVLCLQHVREVECQFIHRCKVSISVRCNDDSRASLGPVRTYFTTPTLYFLGDHPSLAIAHTNMCLNNHTSLLCTSWSPCALNCKPRKTLYWCTRSMTCDSVSSDTRM